MRKSEMMRFWEPFEDSINIWIDHNGERREFAARYEWPRDGVGQIVLTPLSPDQQVKP